MTMLGFWIIILCLVLVVGSPILMEEGAKTYIKLIAIFQAWLTLLMIGVALIC